MCFHTLLALLERMDAPILEIPSQASSANSPRVKGHCFLPPQHIGDMS